MDENKNENTLSFKDFVVDKFKTSEELTELAVKSIEKRLDGVMNENIVSLKEFVLDKFEAVEKSTEIARLGMEKRLDGMNEFRQQLKDQNYTFVTKSEYETKYELLDSKIGSLEKIVYIGLGIVLAVEVALKLLIK